MRVSVVQVDASLAGTANRLSWLETQVRQAAQRNVDLVVFPELYSSGYNVGDAVHRCAEPQDGPFAKRIQTLAKDLGVAVAYGYPERDGTQVYNSVRFIDDRGRSLANHRKTVLPPGHEQDWFTVGCGFSLFRFGGALVAMVICYECEFPEIVRSVVLGGADVVLVATAGGKDWEQVPKFIIPARAYENGVFMVYANYCGVENGHGFCGLSCIVDPSGSDLARAGKAEAVITADLKLDLISKARAQVPFLRHQKEVLSKLSEPKSDCT